QRAEAVNAAAGGSGAEQDARADDGQRAVVVFNGPTQIAVRRTAVLERDIVEPQQAGRVVQAAAIVRARVAVDQADVRQRERSVRLHLEQPVGIASGEGDEAAAINRVGGPTADDVAAGIAAADGGRRGHVVAIER